MKNTYFVYIDSSLVYKGGYTKMVKYLGVTKQTVRNHMRANTPINANGKTYSIVVVKEKSKKDKKEEEYRDIVWHLNEYGNTVVVHEPTELVKRLKKESRIIVDVEHYKAKYIVDEKYREDWVLTVRK